VARKRKSLTKRTVVYCLSGANLENAIMRSVYLGNADLQEANLEDVNFGEYPSIQCAEKDLIAEL